MQGRRVRSSGPVPHAASAITAPHTDHLPVYWQFHEAVTRAQLASWLPSGRHTLVDVSGPRAYGAELAAAVGHTVLRVIDGAGPARGGRGGLDEKVFLREQERGDKHGNIVPLIADASRLSFLRDG